MGLFSKDTTFFEILENQANMAHQVARELQKLVADFPQRADYAQRIDEMESEADNLAHQMANKVDATFITPLDKEDLHHFANQLDDITDHIDSCAARIIMYELPAPRPDLAGLVDILVRITEETSAAMGFFRQKNKNKEQIHQAIIHIHELENQADQGFRGALRALFNAPDADPINVMKWKEVYDRIELAVDKCEDIASQIESALIKYT